MRQLYQSLLKSWFGLTGDEQRAFLAILGLFLLGLAVRTWRCFV
ncbi:hypothetical protein ACFLQU_02360 [Verrucomicrobiota bacterium]